MKRAMIVMLALAVFAGCDENPVKPPVEEVPFRAAPLIGTWVGNGRAVSSDSSGVRFDVEIQRLEFEFFRKDGAANGVGVRVKSSGFFTPPSVPGWSERVDALAWSGDTARVTIVLPQPYGIEPVTFTGGFYLAQSASGTLACPKWPIPDQGRTTNLTVTGTWQVTKQ